MNDEQIIELYWQRNEHAIKESNLQYGAYCHKIAKNILNNTEDSDECVNDTWLRAWNVIPPTRPSKLKLFFAKITRNLAFDKLKAQSAKKRGLNEIDLVLGELSECIADQADVEATIIMKELEQSINDFLRTLSVRDCNLFVRRYFFADSIADISRRYGITENNIMVILSRTRSKLKIHLEKEGYII